MSGKVDFAELEKQSVEDYAKFEAFLKKDPRYDKLMEMYAVYGSELTLAPASGKGHFHNAFPGGYLNHVVRVAEIAIQQAKLFKALGGTIDFTSQELIFAALHHDLGKLGNEDGPYYLDQDSDWHRKRGELYKQNDALQYMKVPDRALYMLQKYDIAITEKEWLGIKLTDGLYDEGNKSYLINYAVYPMKTCMHNILHWADHMASTIENQAGRF
jgi:hypothetical protein